ncbi:unknown [Clostridium sp. CAG:306]|nr:unknown [Clostridium sp. CAG:306]
MSLKQIAFAAKDMQVLTDKQGCYNNCVHCYPAARKPVKQKGGFVNSILFEDLKTYTDSYIELKDRTGINFFQTTDKKQVPYQSLFYDADAIDIAVNDLNGNIHDFPELNKMLYKATGKKGVFDTSGWNPKSRVHQERAQKIVEYYKNPKHADELYQFNLSVNPFHSIYAKSVELKEKGYDKLSEKLYKIYVDRISNALFTFIPLMNNSNFSVILRAFKNDVPNMKDFNEDAISKLVDDILSSFYDKCKSDMLNNKQVITSSDNLGDVMNLAVKNLKYISTNIISGEKIKHLFFKRNPDKSDFEFYKFFSTPLTLSECFDRLKKWNSYEKAAVNYQKIIDSTGKVYLSDNYRIIPTDIQFNFVNKEKKTGGFSMTEDFIVTKEMI